MIVGSLAFSSNMYLRKKELSCLGKLKIVITFLDPVNGVIV